MDAFGDNFGDVDPAAEFLAREQSELAGLEDDLNPVASVPVLSDGFEIQPSSSPTDNFELISNTEQPDNNDLVIGEVTSDIFAFEEPAPIFSEPAAIPEEAPVENVPSKVVPAPVKVPREEPEKIRIWREEQKKRLEEKDENEERKKEEWREAAKKELEEWYRHHEELIAKTKAANRNAEKELVAEVEEIEPGTEWERIAKLCEFNPKASKASRDVSRMRSIILQLKQNPLPRKV